MFFRTFSQIASGSNNNQISARTATSIKVTWTNAGSEAVGYVVSWKTDIIGGCSRSGSSGSKSVGYTNYTITELEEGSCHIITVRAFLADNSQDKNTSTAVTLNSGEGNPLL